MERRELNFLGKSYNDSNNLIVNFNKFEGNPGDGRVASLGLIREREPATSAFMPSIRSSFTKKDNESKTNRNSILKHTSIESKMAY